MARVSLPHVPLPVNREIRPRGRPPMPVSLSTGVPLGHGCGGGSSAALVSAWLPKRTRIESIATSSFCACIFHGASEKDAGEKWRQPRLYRTLVRESRGSPAFLICLTGVALAAGFIPAATMSLKPPSVAPSGFRKIETQRYFGGRVHPGRDHVSHATQACPDWLSKNPNR